MNLSLFCKVKQFILFCKLYRRRERLPEGDRDAIADLVPVWWEFHTVGSDGEALNDFSFSEVRALL